MSEETRTCANALPPTCAQGPSCTAEPPPCTGARSERSPLGVYTASNVQTPFHGVVTHVDLNFQKSDDHDVTYTQHVVGCLFELHPPADPPKCLNKPGPLGPPLPPFTGYFIDSTDNTGSVLIPVVATPGHPLNVMEMAVNKIFGENIHWCPNENHFVVKIGNSPAPFCVLAQPDMVFAAVSPLAGTSDPAYFEGSYCDLNAIGTCGSTAVPASGLTCVCPFRGIGVIGPVCTFGTCQRFYKGKPCTKGALGACGASAHPPSGLKCVTTSTGGMTIAEVSTCQ